ncbi:sphingosine kinase 2-like [Hetaerina americana]|uniref:sphingosine kinase 2-like n=1 Tax=Hetaerina americana TaxID=62018 RepID=UPI003A7F159C
MRSRDLSKWSSIVVVGGDGLLFEVLNGMFERPDWEKAIAIPVAVVPGGSGNGLAKSICYYSGEPYDQNPVLLSSLNIVKGQPLPMDLARVETKSQIMFSFLSVGWGFLADIDIESERLRAMGGQRFTIWSVARLIGLRTYSGRLSYLPVPGHQPIISPDHKGSAVPLPRSISQSAPRGNRDLDIVDEAEDRKLGVFRSRSYNEDLGNGGSMRERFGSVSSRSSMGDGLADDPDGVVGRPRLDSFYSVASRKSTFYSAAASSYLSAVGSSLSVSSLEYDGSNGGGMLPPARMYGPASRLPSLTQPVPSDWKVIEGDFVMVHASYQSHIGSDALFAPNCKLADGIIWLLVVRAGITRAQLLQFLLGLSSGTHLKCPLVEMIPVRAFRLEPKDSNSPTRGHVAVDGELVDYGPLQVELVPSLARVLSR